MLIYYMQLPTAGDWAYITISYHKTIYFNVYLDIEPAVIASPLTEPKSSLGTELFTRIAVELKLQPTPILKGRRMLISSGQRIVDLKNPRNP